MANIDRSVAPTRSFSAGRGLRVDNEALDIHIIEKDASTTATITSTVLKRITRVQVFNRSGQLAVTVTGLNTNQISISGLPVTTFDCVVAMRGSKR